MAYYYNGPICTWDLSVLAGVWWLKSLVKVWRNISKWIFWHRQKNILPNFDYSLSHSEYISNVCFALLWILWKFLYPRIKSEIILVLNISPLNTIYIGVILVGLVQCVTPRHIFFGFLVWVYMYGLRPNYWNFMVYLYTKTISHLKKRKLLLPEIF